MTIRVGILLSHPTQYHSPWFRALAHRPELEIKVFYCFQPDDRQQGSGFEVAFEWDTSLLEGYSYEFLKNVARRAGFHFSGCDTPEIADLIATREFDAWIINGWRVKSEWQAIRGCWKNDVPMLIRGDSHLLDQKPLHVRTAKRMLLGRWIPRFDGYLTVGRLNDEFYRFYGANPSRFFPVRHFVDNERFASQAADARSRAAELRDQWGIPHDSIVFIFVGKFLQSKQPLDVLKAVEIVRARSQRAYLLMVGDGSLRSECEEYSRAKSLPVTFTGFLNQSEIADAYATSAVLVLPSARETWGLVVNEAMSCGVPAIVSDRVGCAPDVVHSGRTGMVFPAHNVEALADAMWLYASNSSLIAEHSAKAQELIANYSVEAATDSTVTAVLTVAKPRASVCAV